MDRETFDLLKNIVLANSKSTYLPLQESVVNTTASTISQPVYSIDPSEIVIKEFPEYEWEMLPESYTIYEDMDEDEFNYNLEKYILNPNMPIEEVFHHVYKLLIDEDYDLDDDEAMRIVGTCLMRFFDELSIDTVSLRYPYQLFFSIYRYLFVNHAIQKLIMVILMMYIVKHHQYRDIYLSPFIYLTLNNTKNILAYLSLFRYIPSEDLYDVCVDEQFQKFYVKMMKHFANDKRLIEIFGLDYDDFLLLLPYLIEDEDTISRLYSKFVINNQIGEFVKYSALDILVSRTTVNDIKGDQK